VESAGEQIKREMKMKRLFLLTVILMAGVVAVQAAGMDYMDADKDGKVSQAEFLSSKKANADKKGTAFDEAAMKVAFGRKDLDKDGFLNAEEQAPAPKKAE
jgi:hypothetical protein